MRRKPGMVLIILTMMTFVLSGCQSDEITGEEVTLEEEALQEEKAPVRSRKTGRVKSSGKEQAKSRQAEQMRERSGCMSADRCFARSL